MILKDSARYRPDSGNDRMRIAPGVDPRALSWGDVYGHATAPPASQCPCGRDPCVCEDYHDEASADWEARQSDIDFDRKQGNTEGFEGKPYHEIEHAELMADQNRFYEMFPHLRPKIPDVNKPTVAPRDAPGGPDTLTHNLYRRPIVGGE